MSKNKPKYSEVFDMRLVKLSLLYFGSSTAFILVLFVNKWFIVLAAPLFFFLGALSRGYNRIKGLYKVIETKEVVKKLK